MNKLLLLYLNNIKYFKMGNKDSRGGIAIEVDKTSYTPGEKISGLVHVDLKNAISCQGIQLKYNMEENFENKVPFKHIPKFNRNMRDQSFIIFKCNNILKAGQYSIPFSFNLSEDCPGTFEYYNQNIICYIKHSLIAFIVPNNSQQKGLSISILLIVKEDLNIYNPVIVNIQDNKKIKNWLILDQGNCILSGNYLNKTYKPKESVDLQIEIDNSNCKANMSKLRVRLYQEINFKHLEFKETIKTVCNEIFIDDICVINFNFVETFRKKNQNCANRFN